MEYHIFERRCQDDEEACDSLRWDVWEDSCTWNNVLEYTSTERLLLAELRKGVKQTKDYVEVRERIEGILAKVDGNEFVTIDEFYHELGVMLNMAVKIQALAEFVQECTRLWDDFEEFSLISQQLPPIVLKLGQLGALSNSEKWIEWRTAQNQLAFENQLLIPDTKMMAQHSDPQTIIALLDGFSWKSPDTIIEFCPSMPKLVQPLAPHPEPSFPLLNQNSFELQHAKMMHCVKSDSVSDQLNELNEGVEPWLSVLQSCGVEIVNQGFDSFEKQALEILGGVAEEFISSLCKNIREIEDDRKSSLDVEMVQSALENVNRGPRNGFNELLEFYEECLSSRKEKVQEFGPDVFIKAGISVPKCLSKESKNITTKDTTKDKTRNTNETSGSIDLSLEISSSAESSPRPMSPPATRRRRSRRTK